MRPKFLHRPKGSRYTGRGAPVRPRGRHFLVALLSLLSLFCAGCAIAASPLRSDAAVVRTQLAGTLKPEVSVLVDDTGAETIETVAGLSNDRFLPLVTPLSSGYTRKAHWLRVVLRRNADAPRRWLLELGPGYLDDVRLYTPDGTTADGFHERVAGDLLPFAEREVPHRLFVFALDLPSGNAPWTIYLRLQSTSTLMAHLTFWDPAAFATATQGEYLALGLLLGALCLMLLYSATYWYFLRERYLLLFIGLVLSMLIAHLGTNGLAEQLLFPSHPHLANAFAPIGSCLLLFFGFWFFLDFLKVWQRHPWLSRFYVGTAMLSIAALPGVVFDYYVEIAPVMMACSLISLPFCLVVAWRSIGLNIVGSRWVAAAYAWYCLMVAGNLLSVLGFIPSHGFMIYGWQYGAPIYVVFLMSGVFTRVREMERRHDQAVASKIAAEEKARIAHAQRQEKSRFLALMTHELKTPLAAIDAAVQALGYAPEAKDPIVSRRHQRIREAVARLNMLLEDSLVMVRDGEESNRPFHFRRNRVVIDDLLRSLSAGYSISSPSGRGISCVRFGSAPKTDFLGDGILLRLALGNLIDNALKYGVAGHEISVSACDRACQGQPGVAFEVESAFDGSPDEDCEAWFDKFWRGSNSAGKDGVGLGLYLVRSIAEAHGGRAYCRVNAGDEMSLSAARLVATLWVPTAQEGE